MKFKTYWKSSDGNLRMSLTFDTDTIKEAKELTNKEINKLKDKGYIWILDKTKHKHSWFQEEDLK